MHALAKHLRSIKTPPRLDAAHARVLRIVDGAALAPVKSPTLANLLRANVAPRTRGYRPGWRDVLTRFSLTRRLPLATVVARAYVVARCSTTSPLGLTENFVREYAPDYVSLLPEGP